jgi:hypothetical protein
LIPVVAACPPLRVGGVAVESVTVCAPPCSAGVILALDPFDRAFHVANHVNTHNSLFITGLNPLTLEQWNRKPA